MKTIIIVVAILLRSATIPLLAFDKSLDDKEKNRGKFLREIPNSLLRPDSISTDATMEQGEFKPSLQFGALMHLYGYGQQTGYNAPSLQSNSKEWNKGFSIYRARFLLGGQLSKKGSFFIETEIPTPIGIQLGGGEKNVKVSPILLDAQYEHVFSNAFQVIAGMQLVSNNRNGLQAAGSLMANDFTYFQYPNNMWSDDPLQGNFGRDLGINLRGFFAKDRLEYRLGMFTGRNIDGQAPPRIVGRAAYNFADVEKDFYYAGTKLGKGKTIALATGFDVQGAYHNLSVDFFMDLPAGSAGSVTLNTAAQYMSGGTNTNSSYTFAQMIPRQTVQFLELGYYFKTPRIQPYIRFENQLIDARGEQIAQSGRSKTEYDKVKSQTVYGGGINYFFAGYNTNVRLSYTARQYNVMMPSGEFTKQSYGQIWTQLQFFIF
jgi:hypothetical protein